MTTEKRLIERALPFSGRYYYQSLRRGSVMGGDVWACDNCGKLITNIVTVTDSTGKTYMIGTDCADTLVKAKCLYQSGDRDYVTDNYTLKACARFVTEVNAGVKMQIEGPQVFITDRKGRQVMEWAHNLREYFPELLP